MGGGQLVAGYRQNSGGAVFEWRLEGIDSVLVIDLPGFSPFEVPAGAGQKLAVTVDGDRLDAIFLDSTGAMLDEFTILKDPSLVADFSADPTAGSAPLAVEFTDLSTNSPTSWSNCSTRTRTSSA